MPVRHVLSTVWRLLGICTSRRRPARRVRSFRRPEFERVNVRAGAEPVRPELTGLDIRYPAGFPERLRKRPAHPGYRWRPSDQYLRRQVEMRTINRGLRRSSDLDTLPPILVYPPNEDNEVTPTRIQPLPNEEIGDLLLEGLPLDLADLEAAERHRRPPVIGPRIPEPDSEDLLTYRRLLPREYRQFLRRSPYPRLAAALLTAAAAVVTSLWISQTRQAEALAAQRFHVARHAFQAELAGALAYGVDPRHIRPLERRARGLDGLTAPPSLIAGRAGFYGSQARAYRVLRARLRLLERRALVYWTDQESIAYAALAEATRRLAALGLPEPLSRPTCAAPACYRLLVARRQAQTARAHETARTLQIDAAPFREAQDPAAGASLAVQKVHALRAVLPASVTAPARIPVLDGMIATSVDAAGYARVGALAHLDADALLAALVARLPARAILISTEDQQMTCYQQRRAICHSPVTARSTPEGVFSIRAKAAAVPALLWYRSGGLLRYVNGALPDWMLFSGQAALQGAPWRTVFGPGSEAVTPPYTPSTPGSVDLPPAAARALFRWAGIGTDVVVY